MAGTWICAVISWVCAALFLGIGLLGGNGEKPMHFWSGSEIPAWRVRDIPAWNREHKKMWCLYSLPYWVSGALYFVHGIAAAVLLVLACTAGFLWMIWRNRRIEKKYLRT